MKGKSVQERIYSTFGEVASSIGYSPIHGRIIGALLVNGGELSLQAVARETGYSLSMVSLSLDLLELREEFLLRDDAFLNEQLRHGIDLDSVRHHELVGMDKLLVVEFLGHEGLLDWR